MTVRLLSRFLAWLSTPSLMRLGAILGWIWHACIPVRRGHARQAVRRAFPEKSEREVRAIVRANFRHLVQSLLEAIALVSYSDERLHRIVRFEGLYEPVAAGRTAGKGSVVLTGHLGSFEFCMGAFGIFHPEIPRVIIARVPKAGFAASLLALVRERTKIEVFEPKNSFRKVVKRLLADKVILGFVMDQNMSRSKGVFVPFLGKLAGTTVGFSVIQRASGAIVVPGWNERLADGTHVGRWGPEVTLSREPNLKLAVLTDAYAMSKLLEAKIRAKPEQWFWVHRRWKSSPVPGDVIRTDAGLEIHGTPGILGAILDRDGTVNMELGRPVLSPEDLQLVPGAAAAIRRLNEVGVPVLLATNQAAIARGHLDEAGLAAIHERLTSLLANEGARIDGIYYCPHHATEGVGPWKVACDCRKPSPGLMKRAAAEWNLNLGGSLFVGDRETDVNAARAAGMRAVAVKNGWAHGPWAPVEADEVAPDLMKAVDAFISRTMGEKT